MQEYATCISCFLVVKTNKIINLTEKDGFDLHQDPNKPHKCLKLYGNHQGSAPKTLAKIT